MSRVFCSFLLLVTLFWVAHALAAPTELATAQTANEGEETESSESEGDGKAEEESEDAEPKADAQDENGESEEDQDTEEDEDDEEDNEDEKSDKKPKPHKVERKPLKIEEEVDGIFVAKEMHEVALRPESWSQFKVVEAVEHGTRVKKGEVLVRFDDEKIEKEIEEESLTQRLSELALMQQEEEFPRIKQLMEIEFDESSRDYEQSQEDYEYYQNVDRPFYVQIANFRYKQAEESLASQQEELDQLLKMYEADEITEETEEIVLRRQRFQVETEELRLELQTASRDFTLNVSLPRRDEYYSTAMKEAELRFQQAKTAKEKGVPRLAFEMQQKRDSRARSIERHAKLLSDRSLMVLRAPADGVVYYGRCIHGKWSGITSYSTKLKPHGTVTANKVLMTIVQQHPLLIEAALTEDELPDFEDGLAATIIPTADDEVELTGKVTRVSTVPDGKKKFVVQLEVDTDDAPQWLVAGMTCKVKVTTYENKKAIVIPTALVQTDEDDEKIKYVMLVESEEAEPVRRDVKLGRTKGKLVEVLEGLDEGDLIVKEEKK